MTVLIKEVTSEADLKEFVKFPDRLYAKEENYIPALHRNQVATLDSKKIRHSNIVKPDIGWHIETAGPWGA